MKTRVTVPGFKHKSYSKQKFYLKLLQENVNVSDLHSFLSFQNGFLAAGPSTSTSAAAHSNVGQHQSNGGGGRVDEVSEE